MTVVLHNVVNFSIKYVLLFRVVLLLIANCNEEKKIVEHVDVLIHILTWRRVLHCAKKYNVDAIFDSVAMYQMITKEEEENVDAKLKHKYWLQVEVSYAYEEHFNSTHVKKPKQIYLVLHV